MPSGKDLSAALLGSRGGKARAAALTPEERSAAARVAIAARLAKEPPAPCPGCGVAFADRAERREHVASCELEKERRRAHVRERRKAERAARKGFHG